MKSVIIILILCICGFSANAQNKFSGNYNVTLDLSQLKDQPNMIYFWYTKYVNGDKQQEYDSVKVIGKTVQFKGVIDEPSEAFLSRVSQRTKEEVPQGDFFNFYLEPKDLTIKSIDSLSNYTVYGGLYSKDFAEFNKMDMNYNERMSAFYPELNRTRGKDTVAYKKAVEDYMIIFNEYTDVATKDFVINHPNSPVSLLPLAIYTGFIIKNPEGADSVFQTLDPSIKELAAAIRMKKLIEIAKRTNIGQSATNFSLPDTSGKLISLASFKGKYVLLDFWASWCGPCRAENPTVVADYDKYKKDNFTILSVSLDGVSTKAAWIKAIHDDHLGQWTHISDLKQFNNEAAKLYGVTAIPQNFLIDPSGKIIAKNLRGEELTAKLAELFGKM